MRILVFCFLFFSQFNLWSNNSVLSDSLKIERIYSIIKTEKNQTKKLSLIHKIISFSQTKKLIRQQIRGEIELANFFSDQPLHSQEILMKTLHLAEKLNDYKLLLKVLSNIQENYSYAGNLNKGMEYAIRSYQLAKKQNDKFNTLLQLNSIGVTFVEMKVYEKALNTFNLIEKQNKLLKYNSINEATLINKGLIFRLLNKNNEAIINFEKALKIEGGFADKYCFIYNELAQIYLAQKQTDLALKYAKLSESNANNTARIERNYINKTLYQIYKANYKNDNALKYLEIYNKVKLLEDSTKNKRLTSLLDLSYQNVKQATQISNLDENLGKIKNRNIYLISGIFLTLFILGVLLFFYFKLNRKNTEINLQKLKIEDLNQNLEAKVLHRTQDLEKANNNLALKNKEIQESLFKGQKLERQRISAELHDQIGGTLNSLSWGLQSINLKNLNEKEQVVFNKVLDIAKNAYTDVRSLSHNLIPKILEQKGLNDAIENLINDLNQNKNIAFTFISNYNPAQKNPQFELNIYAVIMELLSNILKHSKAKVASISLNQNEDSIITIKSKDNGIGFSSEFIGGGMGFENLKNRVGLFNGDITINNIENGSEIIIHFNSPIHSLENNLL